MRKTLLVGILLIFALNLSLVLSVDMNLSIVGKDNLEGVRRIEDYSLFKMNFSGVEATELPPDSIRINDVGVDATCTSPSEKFFTCEYQTPVNYVTDPSINYNVKLEIGGKVLASERMNLYVDGLGPEILSVKGIPSGFKPADSFKVKVTAREKGVEGGSFCAGFDYISIYQEDPQAPAVKHVVETEDCYVSNQEIEVEGSQLATGKLCVAGVDVLAQVSEKPICKDIVVDSEPPRVQNVMLYSNGKSLEYVREGLTYEVVPKANITENGPLKASKVIANFSSINPGYVKLRPKECNEVGENLYECEWTQLNLRLSEPKELPVEINVTDEAGQGHSVKQQFSFDIQLDSDGPSVNEITTLYGKYEGVNYLGETSVVVLDISDSQSGISPENVFIDASDMQAGSKISPDYCEEQICYFENFKTGLSHNGSGEIKVHSDSKDNAGNKLDEYAGEGFIVDKKAPEFHNATFRSSEGMSELKGGDTLVVTVYVKDDTQAYISGDFSKVARGEVRENACEFNADASMWKCVLDVPDLISGSQAEVKYKIRDFTNNTIEKTANVLVNIPYMGPNPDYWELTDVEVSEPGLDVEVSAVVEQNVFVTFFFDAKIGEQLKLAEMKVISCDGADFENFNVMLPDVPGNSVSVPVVMKIGRGELDPTTIQASCTLELYTKRGKQLTANPEKEEIEFEIPVFEGISGMSSSDITEKIKAEIEWLDWTVTVVEPVQTFYETSRELCKALDKLAKGTAGFNIISEPLKNMLSGVGLGMLASSIDASAIAATLGEDAFVKTLSQFCGHVSCSARPDIEILPDFPEKLGLYDFGKPAVGDSLLYDTVTLCLPGMVSGAYDYLKIGCSRLDCYGKALEKGTPLDYCEQVVGYAYCTEIGGDVLGFFPSFSMWKEVGSAVKNLFSNPLSFVGGIVSFVCGPDAFAPSPTTTLGSACRTSNLLVQAADVGNLVYDAVDLGKQLFSDKEEARSYCRQVINKYSKYVD
jgi:hypothetical protein